MEKIEFNYLLRNTNFISKIVPNGNRWFFYNIFFQLNFKGNRIE
jgi:hypothetical protein